MARKYTQIFFRVHYLFQDAKKLSASEADGKLWER